MPPPISKPMPLFELYSNITAKLTPDEKAFMDDPSISHDRKALFMARIIASRGRETIQSQSRKPTAQPYESYSDIQLGDLVWFLDDNKGWVCSTVRAKEPYSGYINLDVSGTGFYVLWYDLWLACKAPSSTRQAMSRGRA